MVVRRPSVAGLFYPGDPEGLKRKLEEFMRPRNPRNCFAVISPHAGYMYSGSVAGAVFSEVNVPHKVVILNPNHTGIGPKVSVFPEGKWIFPGFEVEIDEELSNVLLENEFAESDMTAQESEHSAEVQVPFIWFRNPEAKISTCCIRTLEKEVLESLGETLIKVKRMSPDVLFVVSSDMNHYEPDEISRKKDMVAIERILNIDPDGLLDEAMSKNISMCGIAPATAVLMSAKKMGIEKAELLAYTNSGDITGDKSAVVGYAGIAVG